MSEIKCIEWHMTRLKLLPVCDCGYVFKDGVICGRKYHTVDGIEYSCIHPTYFIEPNICPNCNKRIKCIEYDRDKITFVTK